MNFENVKRMAMNGLGKGLVFGDTYKRELIGAGVTVGVILTYKLLKGGINKLRNNNEIEELKSKIEKLEK